MVPDTPARLSKVVESNPSALDEFCQPLLQSLRDFGFTEDDVFGVHLAVEEAFHNAVEHGNQRDAGKKVTVDYTVSREKVEIKITDEGSGFDPGTIPDPRVGDNLYRPNGRGLLLITAYMDEVHYNQSGNCVTMVRLRLRPEQATPSETPGEGE
jgi:serine/threonine-protein kinase RsbW